MASSDPIRFGAIGCGGAGTNRIQQLAQHELGVRVVAAVDINPARLDNLESVLGYTFKRYEGPEDYKRLIDENELDAVGIFTPHIPHLEHVTYAIEADKHILIEKPMVCGAANAMRITRMLDERGLTGIVHYQRHYELKFMKAREMIQKGMIGDVETFFVYMAQDWYGREWRGDPAFSGGGQINDSGSHYQDILLWMTGLLPKSAEGHVDMFYHGQKKQVEINGSFNVELSNGAGGRIIILGDIPGGFVDDVRIVGTEGDLMFYGNQVLHRPKGGEIREVPMKRPKGYPESPCDNFVKLLRKRSRVNRVPFIFGARVALLTEAMLTSAHAGGKKVDCADILDAAGYSMDDLAD
jgi:predicted dehydrogenase